MDTIAQTRIEAAILRLMAQLDRPAHEASVVKMAYLADHEMFRVAGFLVTGCEYVRDYDGPRAKDYAVAAGFRRLIRAGALAWIKPGHPLASPRYALKSAEGAWAFSAGVFRNGEDQVLWDTVARCADLDSLEIADLARKTDACKRARSGETIEFAKAVKADWASWSKRRRLWDEWEAHARERAERLADNRFATAEQVFAGMMGDGQPPKRARAYWDAEAGKREPADAGIGR